ncbi:motility associated factor glycosyltransferase family protein [Campylobacter vulpis]|uniref:motility associated factor glycosyltransferase family protein n=1 Tax=Campylobacter vulpis TaxID=1655500 RepID=UPI000C146706|nr:6-hydroxymethylpterin diphosphokinase MptE-like protein [Campylobacter vulpis]MBS4275214.1 motility associated factor glycosyltransferase family protein [Campylobacter vulpis]MBS4306216.1 motility associated factor glycosyltransferase family protein [Campylobacter vulpis]MBS4329532.1 motility associated factor glycosyltransferase family protein [Campylobacter vulpis]MBS4422952.1 motility associated factor glycosyltransferase family protein [Campylobacter vulpis]PHY91766.1 motility accessory
MNLIKNIKALKQSNPSLNLPQKQDKFEFDESLNPCFKEGKIYQNVKEELSSKLIFLKTHYAHYPVLYFYGFGNGTLYKILCQTQDKIIVFEEDLELLSLVFSFIDFSEELLSKKLILITNLKELDELFEDELIQTSYKIYTLFSHSPFYKNENFELLHRKIKEHFDFLLLQKGNDPEDTLTGMKHTLINLKTMLEKPKFKDFLKTYRFKNQNAIIVSTGPSLTKQLPLLKEVQEKAVIFAADSAYAILKKEGIRADFVFSLERLELTSEFFNQNFNEFDENVLFIITSLTHPNTLKYLKNQNFLLVLRPFYFEKALKCDEFGYLGVGASVANMAYECAAALRFENIIFIGQDLAYDDMGLSHEKSYTLLSYHKNDFQNDKDKFLCEAYGGQGLAQSSLAWTLFRLGLQEDILNAKKLNINTYNATQGGARIEGTCEKSFAWCCENLFKAPKKKLPIKSVKISTTNALLSLKNLLEKGEKFEAKLETILRDLEQALNEKQNLEYFLHSLEKLSKEFKEQGICTDLFLALLFDLESERLKLRAENADILTNLKTQKGYFAKLLRLLKKQNALLKEHNESI